MRWLAAVALLFLFAGGIYYERFYPPTVLKHKTAQVLQDLSKIIATKDRTKIGAALQRWLTDNAQIRLTVAFASLSPSNSAPAVQDFNKQNFIPFIDNVLYSLSDYGWQPELRNFRLSADRKTADVTFTSQGWAEGMSYDGGIGINMRFDADATCRGQVVFEHDTVQLGRADCTVTLRMAPKR